MILAVDIGNTNLTVGVFDKETLKGEFRLATDAKRTDDQYAVDLGGILNLHGITPSMIEGVIMCSVSPEVEKRLVSAVRKLVGKEAMLVGPGIKTGMDIRIDNPAQLGADILVGCLAAREQYGAPCIVWDFGTATTAFAVDKNGAVRGGVIIPGVMTSLDSLVSRASLLPRIRVEAPDHVIGTNTTDSMRAGLVLSAASMVDGICERMEKELGYPMKAVVTGGLSAEIAKQCKRDVHYDGQLILNGLYYLYQKNH